MNSRTLAADIQGIRFSVYLPDGQTFQLGQDGPAIDWHVHSERTLRRILRHPQRELGCSYVRGQCDIDTRELPALLLALETGAARRRLPAAMRGLRERLRAIPCTRVTAPPRWEDTSLWLSCICLGEELFQGCAHYSEPGTSLEQAQRTRGRVLATRLQLEPGQHLLDVSAGWGALPLYLAERTGVRVTGLVATREQLQHAHNEAQRRGLDAIVHFRLGGFRQCQGRFDRILGSDPLTGEYQPAPRIVLERLAGLLADDGLLWLQIVGHRDNDPGGHWQPGPRLTAQPRLSELHRALEHAHLHSLLQEDLSAYRLQDLRARAQRYRNKRAAISQRFGERHTRYWEFQIASEIAAVETRRLLQYELILGKGACRWPASGARDAAEARLPVEIARSIPGLARDI